MLTKDFIKGLFKNKKQYRVSFDTVEIDYSEFDSGSISSTFRYAVSKYGESICNEADRLKNILSDLAPHLSKEIKLLHYLCKNGNLGNVLNICDKDDSELFLWVNNAIGYLVNDEMIDDELAHEFCIHFICDIVGKDISNGYLQSKQEEAQEEELNELLNHAKLMIEEECYVEADGALDEICAKSKDEKTVSEARILLELIAERKLKEFVDEITNAIDEGHYKDASNKLETAKKVLSRCGDSKNIKNLSNQLKKNEEKLEDVIQKCLKNADRSIKRKEYDKADIYINQTKEVAGDYFEVKNIQAFWRKRIFIEKMIDEREFETAINSINNLQQSVGLEKEFAKYISYLERRIKWYRILLVLSKFLVFAAFVMVLAIVNKYTRAFEWGNIIRAVNMPTTIILAVVAWKSKRKRILVCNASFLLMNYVIWIFLIYYMDKLVNVNIIRAFSLLFPLLCGVVLIKNVNRGRVRKIILYNIGIILGIIILMLAVQKYVDKGDNSYEKEQNVSVEIGDETEVFTYESFLVGENVICA